MRHKSISSSLSSLDLTTNNFARHEIVRQQRIDEKLFDYTIRITQPCNYLTHS